MKFYDVQIIRQQTETGMVFILLCQQDGKIVKVLQIVNPNDIEIIDKGTKYEKIDVTRTYVIPENRTSGKVIEDENSEYLYTFISNDKQGFRVKIEGLQIADKNIQNKFIKLTDKINDIV